MGPTVVGTGMNNQEEACSFSVVGEIHSTEASTWLQIVVKATHTQRRRPRLDELVGGTGFFRKAAWAGRPLGGDWSAKGASHVKMPKERASAKSPNECDAFPRQKWGWCGRNEVYGEEGDMQGGRTWEPRRRRRTTWVSRAVVMSENAISSAIRSPVNTEMFSAGGKHDLIDILKNLTLAVGWRMDCKSGWGQKWEVQPRGRWLRSGYSKNDFVFSFFK